MRLRVLPRHFTRVETLKSLIDLLDDKERLRRNLDARDFGSRITDLDEARLLFSRVIKHTHQVVGLDNLPETQPDLVLTRRLSRLPQRIMVLYLLFIPVCVFLLLLSLYLSGGGPGVWLARGASLSLLVIPLLLYRCTRINIEHQCGYVRNWKGEAAIVMDQLQAIQFQSYLAHEYAHHLYVEQFGAQEEEWNREGWSRLVQWEVAQHLYRQEGNPAYLHHVLIQIVGELKFACQILAKTLHCRLPRQVRRISSIYHPNPVHWLLTGTPGFNAMRLLDHAVGTATYFLAAEDLGPKEALRSRPGSETVTEQMSSMGTKQ
ncbi:MAG: hypothetical protein ACLFVT_01990 [Syntrophobacteria bacterium]